MALVPDDEDPAQAAPAAPATRTLVPDPEPSTLQWLRESVPSAQSVVRGIPILGPAFDAGTTYLLSKGQSAVTGEPRSDIAKRYEAENERVRADHPIADAAGGLAGGLISTVPVARAVPALFGGSSWLGQTAAGAALGGADAGVRSGGDLDAMKTGAMIGGAAPTVASTLAPAGQAVAAAWRGLRDRVPGVSSAIQAAGFKPSVDVPTGQQTIDAADGAFRSLQNMMVYPRSSLDILANQIRTDLSGQSRSAQLGAVQTHTLLDALDSLPPTPGSLHTLRKALGAVQGGDEGASARIARDHIDAFLGAPQSTTGAAVNPRAGQAGMPNPGQVLADANANWQAGQASRTINERVLDKADREALQVNGWVPDLAAGQILRKDAKNLLQQNKTEKFWTPEQRDTLNNAMRTQSLGQFALENVGKMSQTARPGLGSLVAMIAAGGGGAGLGFSAPVVAALGLGGAASNVVSSGMTRSAIRHADELIRARSPFGQAAVNAQANAPHVLNPTPYKALYNSVTPQQHRDEISRLLMLQAERAATENNNAP